MPANSRWDLIRRLRVNDCERRSTVQNETHEPAFRSTFNVTCYSLDSMRDKIDCDAQLNELAGLCMFKHSKFGFIQFKLNNLHSWEVCESGGGGGSRGENLRYWD